MPQTKYELTRSENSRLDNLLGVAKIQEELLNSITESYRNFIIGTILPRLGLKSEVFPRVIINLATGELVVKEPETKPENPVKVEVKGEK